MQFKRYNSIENSYRDKFIYQIQEQGLSDGEWVVTEKIHGANFSVHYDGETVRFAKRSGFIGDDENFMGCQTIKDYLNNLIKAVYQHFDDDSTLSIYGEICGGYYNDRSNNPYCVRVQKEVKYHPDNRFLVFDIQVNGCFVDQDLFDELYNHYGFMRVPELFRGSFTECLNHSNQFQTQVPALFGLPEIEDNICEGIVIKPVTPKYLEDGTRVILKSKNEKFSEKRSEKEEKIGQTNILSPAAEEEYQNIKTYITENRLKNVLSKIGTLTHKDFGKLLGEFVQDVLGDYYKDLTEAPVFIEKAEQKLVNKLINRTAANLIRPNFINIVDGSY